MHKRLVTGCPLRTAATQEKSGLCGSGCDYPWLRDAAILLAAGIAIGVVAAIASAATLQSMLGYTGNPNPVALTIG
jgi:hypothetical protein